MICLFKKDFLLWKAFPIIASLLNLNKGSRMILPENNIVFEEIFKFYIYRQYLNLYIFLK